MSARLWLTRRCDCSHIVKQFWDYGEEHPGGPCPGPEYCIDAAIGKGHGQITTDVVERPCPHSGKGYGTIINEHCPKCDLVVGQFGYGAAGSLDCPCENQTMHCTDEEASTDA